MFLSIIARILSAAVSVYFFLCVVRVILTWVPQMDLGKGGEILSRAVDPYLRYFSRFSALRSRSFDFSPIVALAVLILLGQFFTTLAFTGRISVGIVLGMVLGVAWSAVAFFLTFFAVCALLRIIAYAARWNSLHPLWRVIDSFLNPVLYRINRVIYRNRIVNYLQGLITGFIIVVLAQVAFSRLIGFIVSLLQRLPI